MSPHFEIMNKKELEFLGCIKSRKKEMLDLPYVVLIKPHLKIHVQSYVKTVTNN